MENSVAEILSLFHEKKSVQKWGEFFQNFAFFGVKKVCKKGVKKSVQKWGEKSEKK
jgi:hypothetical protein